MAADPITHPLLQSGNNVSQRISHPTGHDAPAVLLRDHMTFVRAIAMGFHRRLPRHMLLEDLVQAGAIGLIDALQRFDSGRGIAFRKYAAFRIKGAILDSIRQNDWSPRSLRKSQRRLNDAHSRLCREHGSQPDEGALAQELGVSVEKFHKLVQQVHTSRLCQLGPEHLPKAEGKHSPLQNMIRSEMLNQIREAMQSLNESERQVVELYYFQEVKMKDIAALLKVGESRASQIHSAAIRKVRNVVATCER